MTQTFTDFELVLVDDGSTDNCGSICDEYAKKDNRVVSFHQDNRGQAAARNFALDWIFTNSDSKYISFVDSDDWVHPQYLEKMIFAIEKYDIFLCQCNHLRTDTEVPFCESEDADENVYLITPEEQYANWFSAYFWGKLFKKECFTDFRFPQGVIFEDVLIWYKLLFSYY